MPQGDFFSFFDSVVVVAFAFVGGYFVFVSFFAPLVVLFFRASLITKHAEKLSFFMFHQTTELVVIFLPLLFLVYVFTRVVPTVLEDFQISFNSLQVTRASSLKIIPLKVVQTYNQIFFVVFHQQNLFSFCSFQNTLFCQSVVARLVKANKMTPNLWPSFFEQVRYQTKKLGNG